MRIDDRLKAMALCAALGLLAGGGVVIGEDEPAPEPAPAESGEEGSDGTTEATEGGGEEAEALPGLDELLGLPSSGKPADEEGAALYEELDPSKIELDRKLTAKEAADKLASAVQQMEETAFRMERVRDTGLVTQRLQEEIITKLDVLIKQAEQSSSSSSSSSSSQSQPSQMQPGDQQQSSQNQSQPSGDASQAGSNAAGGLPAFEQNPGDQLDAARAAWGALPERVREKLLEGTSDYFSEYYRALTEAYYKRLAEEASE